MRRAVLLALLPLAALAQDGLTPSEQRGRQIYERGASPSGGSIEAMLPGDVKVPGSVLPCVNCHGADGQGKPEGGIAPSNINWDALTKPYFVARSGRRTNVAYTDRLFKRAIAMGVDSAGNQLNPAMPRFALSIGDAGDLLAYVKRLGQSVDRGISAGAVRLGVIAGPSPQDGPIMRTAMRTAVSAYFAQVNESGGIFGRLVQLEFLDLPASEAERKGAALGFLHDRQIFAAIADFSGAEAEMAAAMSDASVPAVAAFAQFPWTGLPLNSNVFYLDGGIAAELEALAGFASTRFPSKDLPIAIRAGDSELSRDCAKWLQSALSQAGRRVVAGDGPAGLVFWLSKDAGQLEAAASVEGVKAFLVPGSLAVDMSKLSAIARSKVFLAVDADAPEDPARLAWARATASAEVMAGALKNAGRSVSRAALIAALEDFRSVQTNYPALLTFGPNRRIGANPVRLMTFDAVSGNLIPAPEIGAVK